MAETCARIQELLSAYLDGRLSPDETTRVSAHLETCPECAALLEQMRKLDGIAASAMDDIDDAVLGKLEQRIRDDIERLPTVNVEEKPKVGRVIPIWYRYVAVAASVVLVFMIGRAFYKGGGLDEWIPGHQIRTVQINRPPSTAPQSSSVPVQIKPDTVSSGPAAKRETDQAVTIQTKPSEPKQVSLPKATAPMPTTDTKLETATAKQGIKPVDALPSEDIRIATQAELKDISRDKETARSDYQEMGKVVVAAPEVESPTGGADSKATTDESRSKETILEKAPDAASTIEKKASQLKAQAFQELGKLGYNNAIAPPALSRSKASTLQSRYAAALAGYKPAGGIVGGFAAKPKGGDSTAAVRFVLGRADDMPETSDLDNQATKLYLTARADYDLYRFTGERSYYDRAVSARDSLLHFLDQFAGDSQKAEAAEAYRKELQQFQCQE